jgi:hypothetical protein
VDSLGEGMDSALAENGPRELLLLRTLFRYVAALQVVGTLMAVTVDVALLVVKCTFGV